jgi:hypothetical protein
VVEPRTIEAMGLTVAMVRDPDGYLIELVRQDGEAPSPVTRPL